MRMGGSQLGRSDAILGGAPRRSHRTNPNFNTYIGERHAHARRRADTHAPGSSGATSSTIKKRAPGNLFQSNYSQVRNIADRWMPEERTHELRVSPNLCKLFVNPWSQ